MSARQQALKALLSFTKLSRTIAGVLVAMYVIQLIAPASRQYTALVAGRFIPCAWSVFTAGILETHLLKVGQWSLDHSMFNDEASMVLVRSLAQCRFAGNC